VVSSYSGNTAETLASFEEAVARGCRVLPITSGGTLAARADELGLGVVRIPGGFMPRAALGYLALSLLGAMESVGLLPSLAGDVDEATGELGRLVEVFGPDRPTERNEAKAVAERIGHRQPVVWGADGLGAVAAARWKTQLNENGKVPAWSAALPELDHNEVVGWHADGGASSFVVALRHEGEHEDVAVRFPISLEIARDAGVITEEVWATGRSVLARFMSLAIMGDFVSCYVGLRRGVDPSPIPAIDRLKSFLDGARSR
jgi:glucose/mannose-6-phosphate isomerase